MPLCTRAVRNVPGAASSRVTGSVVALELRVDRALDLEPVIGSTQRLNSSDLDLGRSAPVATLPQTCYSGPPVMSDPAENPVARR